MKNLEKFKNSDDIISEINYRDKEAFLNRDKSCMKILFWEAFCWFSTKVRGISLEQAMLEHHHFHKSLMKVLHTLRQDHRIIRLTILKYGFFYAARDYLHECSKRSRFTDTKY